ncbi:DoxX family protein [Mycobacterium sp. 852014-52144_SCH5372336]|uniref:DoxX family protein n=1 Tax=Mycobacterium sp. 852014-52144_SCH5372336 TaxID=1834115 RepID=UPI0007FEAF89|nr:DoxX family protein [Mycobacterium sp. 852014-52144_SCH5372336]OBB77897.1 DoxX family protein [Mycobacterium sp. 852014-52144_SCH5372336]
MTTFDARLSSYSSPLLSLFRIIAGLMFFLHGTMKIFGWPIGEAIPVGTWPLWWAGLIELVAGLLITVGLFTRIAAFIASGEMAVAYFWMHWPPLEGPPASFWPFENGGEAVLLYCFGFLAIAGLGAGAWSADARRRTRVGGAAPGRVVTGTAAPAATAGPAATAAPVRRRGLLSRFRR